MSDEEVTTDDTEGRAHTGKRVGSTTYWHRSAIPAQHAELVAKADALASEHGQGWSGRSPKTGRRQAQASGLDVRKRLSPAQRG